MQLECCPDTRPMHIGIGVYVFGGYSSKSACCIFTQEDSPCECFSRLVAGAPALDLGAKRVF